MFNFIIEMIGIVATVFTVLAALFAIALSL